MPSKSASSNKTPEINAPYNPPPALPMLDGQNPFRISLPTCKFNRIKFLNDIKGGYVLNATQPGKEEGRRGRRAAGGASAGAGTFCFLVLTLAMRY